MDSRKYVFHQTCAIAIGQVLCGAAMTGIFALLGKFDGSIILSAAVGALLATLNFFIMATCANIAADKAEKQDVKGGQALIQMSYMGRMIGLLVVLVICAKSGLFNLLALVLPLAFTRPILSIAEIVNRKAEKQNEHEC